MERAKNDVALAEIVQDRKRHRADREGHVALRVQRPMVEHELRHDRRQRVRHKVADHHVQHILREKEQPVVMAVERVLPVQEIRHRPADEIVAGRRDPVAHMQAVVEQEHQPRPYAPAGHGDGRIDPEGLVKNIVLHLSAGSPPGSSPPPPRR